MKILIILLAAFSIYNTSLGQKTPASVFTSFTIDTTLNSKLAKAKLKSEFNLPMIDDGFWFIMDKKNYQEFIGKTNPNIFFDTLQSLTDVVCDCMIKKDTIYLQGGIAYGGGMGFDVKIVNNLFNGKIWLAGKSYRTNNSFKFTDEILLNSASQKLKIQSRDALKRGKKLIGELLLESEDYFAKDDKSANRMYLKLLFGCKLDDAIAF
jgi:hypothetical protein